ncbi:Serine/arginine-rich splicing factor 2 [Phytophthora ramorum]|uniref:Serine/arginine-rich splicing factor 2 n=1 Tax=Phytophthora ramorum TaxID=164328 RepID=UPI0030B264B5|nr:Serine/arginine-rich splicing factor 2 [Phytophthora ramorum]
MAPPNVDSMFTLKVDNVPFQIGSDELRELFSKFGEIGDVYIPRARGSNESRGFAFVRFVEKRDAEDAIEAMEGQEFQGRDLRVQFAKQRRPDNPREFYSGGSGGSGGGGRGGGDRYGGGGGPLRRRRR